eukprot:m.731276 g.731276  ORF g.731276 m.731276 type:complete len:293 (+) comp23057_c0_seq28:1160-2038(+)
MAQAAIALFAKSIGRCWTLCLGHLPTFTHVGCAPQAATTYMCRIPGCERSYFSEQGVKYHMKHHHTAADLADAPVVRSVSKETSAAQDKASATSTSASVSTPNVTSTASKGATASSERNHRGSYDGETESGGDAKRRKVGDRTRSMTSRVLPRIGRAKDLPCYKSAVSLIGGRNFGGMSTVEGKGVYRTLVKRAAGDELERNTVDVLHRLEDLQCKTIQVIEDVGALQAERASLLDETPDESGHGKRGANAEDDPVRKCRTLSPCKHSCGLSSLVGLPHTVKRLSRESDMLL